MLAGSRQLLLRDAEDGSVRWQTGPAGTKPAKKKTFRIYVFVLLWARVRNKPKLRNAAKTIRRIVELKLEIDLQNHQVQPSA